METVDVTKLRDSDFTSFFECRRAGPRSSASKSALASLPDNRRMNETITIATRESRLALWQAEHVKALLQARGLEVALLGMTTRGDQILDRTLSKVGGKGLFVKELETALEEDRAQLAVHSLEGCAHGAARGLRAGGHPRT